MVQPQKAYGHKNSFGQKASLNNQIVTQSDTENDENGRLQSEMWNKLSRVNNSTPDHKVGSITSFFTGLTFMLLPFRLNFFWVNPT